MDMSQMVRRMERTSSIENEPRTLNINQIHFAREAALYVVNTKGIEEAMRIFTEGLEPVVSCVGDDKCDMMMDYNEEEEEELQCLSVHHLKLPGFQDISSAPF